MGKRHFNVVFFCKKSKHERLVHEQAENKAMARLNASEAERLQNQAETVKGGTEKGVK